MTPPDPSRDTLLDITAPESVQVEVMKAAGGHDVLYVHVDGMTRLRVCRFKHLELPEHVDPTRVLSIADVEEIAEALCLARPGPANFDLREGVHDLVSRLCLRATLRLTDAAIAVEGAVNNVHKEIEP